MRKPKPTKRKPLPVAKPAPVAAISSMRPNPGHITREAALEGDARRLAEYSALGEPHGQDMAAQSRAAADLANGR